jgi:Skp family chaperone for outer membrane proteins
MGNYSLLGFLKSCCDFISYVIDFITGRRQNQVNKINTDLQDQYNKIDQDKENNKQNDTQNRLDNLFKR